ncbi:MAG: riboflavin kinase [Candidatus Omnitrophota bacterium]
MISQNKEKNSKKFVVTLGVFDGLHLGHQRIIKEVLTRARHFKALAAVVTFWPHPREITGGNFEGYIMNLEEKKHLLFSLGIDSIFILRSCREFLNMAGDGFISKLTKKIHFREMVVGEGFKFGQNGLWHIKELNNLSRGFQFNLRVIKKIRMGKKNISSSLIRKLIRRADFFAVRKLLARPYIMPGIVESGRGMGRRLGFPTANINNYQGFVMPKQGVYAVYVYIGKDRYLGAANIGVRPTVYKEVAGKTVRKNSALSAGPVRNNQHEKKNICEVTIMNFKKNIVGKKINLLFLERVRNERKFASRIHLKEAIRRDVSCITAKYSIPAANSTQLIGL